MKTLTNPTVVKIKGLLFFILGLLSSTMLIMANPTLGTVLILMVTVWSFCRCYYFAFYVIENYIDRKSQFSGIVSMLKYLTQRRRR
jgi:hypothetical protein